MWSKLLAETDWKILRDFLSPSLFSVFPSRALAGEARALLASASSRRGFADAARLRLDSLRRAGVPVRLSSEPPPPSALMAPLDEAARVVRGQALLNLFFHQLYADGPTILDLRFKTLFPRPEGDEPEPPFIWVPGRPHTKWEPGFRSALHDLYGGFYDGDDPRFMRGLQAIGAVPAEATFREQFGAEDPHAVTFDLERFVRTFHAAFEACRDAGSPLHRQLVPLGVYLAGLYEHLSELGGTFDVRDAFLVARAHAAGCGEA
jgi:hypothetical protein